MDEKEMVIVALIVFLAFIGGIVADKYGDYHFGPVKVSCPETKCEFVPPSAASMLQQCQNILVDNALIVRRAQDELTGAVNGSKKDNNVQRFVFDSSGVFR